MDPLDCFSNFQLRHFQYIFNLLQCFNSKLKIFDLQAETDFLVSHLPGSINLPYPVHSFCEISHKTDTTRIRRQCLIIAFPSDHKEGAEHLRKIFLKNKCKEIHMVENIQLFISQYRFLLDKHKITDYPNEIMPKFLYLGTEEHAYDLRVIKDLKVTHVVNATQNSMNKFKDLKYCRVIVCDKAEEPIFRFFQKAYAFIEEAMHENQMGASNVVLVHCAQGVSRSVTIVMMFLMKTFGMSIQEALDFIKTHRHKADPNPGFVKQLETFYLHKYKFSKSFAGLSLLPLE